MLTINGVEFGPFPAAPGEDRSMRRIAVQEFSRLLPQLRNAFPPGMEFQMAVFYCNAVSRLWHVQFAVLMDFIVEELQTQRERRQQHRLERN